MSTSSVTPNASDLPLAAPSEANVNVSQTPPQQDTPAPQPPPSRLGVIINAVAKATNPQPTTTAPANNTPPPQPSWKTNLGKVASVVSTGLAGIPDKGRSSFVTGLGEGARSEQAAQANQQAIKFQSFQDQVRAAQLHNEDLRLQMATDDHQTAVQDRADAEAKRMTDTTGMTYTRVPNTAADVMTHMTTDQAQNGAATVSPGTIMGPHYMYVPNKGSEDQAKALTQDYNWRSSAYGLPSVPPNQVVQPNAYDQLRQASNGLDNAGHPMSAADIGNRVDNLTSYLKANSGHIPAEAASAIQSDIDHLTDLQTHHAARDQAGIDQARANKDKQTQDITNIQTAGKEQLLKTKAANAPANTNMFVGTDAAGNQIAGTSDDLKAAGAQGVTKLDADTGKKVITARQLISPEGLFAQIKQDMLNLDAKGKMGSSATARFNDALLSKAGADPEYAPLFVHTHLLSTALMQAHVGSRGSSDMMEEFQKLANSGKMNAPTLRSALGAEYKYVHEKAMLPKKQQTKGGAQ